MDETYIAFEADSLSVVDDSLAVVQDSLAIDTLQQTVTVEPPEPTRFEGTPRKESFATQGSVTLLLLLQFFFLAFSFQFIVRQSGSVFKTLDFSRQTTTLFTGKEILQTLLLFVFSCLNLSLLFYILFTGQPILLWLDFLPIAAGFVILFLFKIAVDRLLGFVFFNKNITSFWIQIRFVVLVLLNALIFPVTVWVIYFRAPIFYLLYAAVIAAFIALVMAIYRLLRIFPIRLSSFSHIILYLCILEIMPFLLLYFVLTKMQIFN
ncbi:MAG: DUF4271 domain-containing protein [Prevotellaceae bacterium]|jgi:hypothetical protein|nr:DUF4271 domain-containing protein [Prevotellaceae bacterium]